MTSSRKQEVYDRQKEQYESELEWIKFREHTLGELAYEEETNTDKFTRKIKENPLVPFGALATLGALGYGLTQFRKGNAAQSQMGMRMRIGAQAFTIFAILGGIIFGFSKPTGVQVPSSSPSRVPPPPPSMNVVTLDRK